MMFPLTIYTAYRIHTYSFFSENSDFSFTFSGVDDSDGLRRGGPYRGKERGVGGWGGGGEYIGTSALLLPTDSNMVRICVFVFAF